MTQGIKRILYKPFFIRLFNWEYWSADTVYACIYPIWFLLAIRARSFFFFSASNPNIKNGGFLNESKKDIHKILPTHLYPKTLHFPINTKEAEVIEQLKKENFSFPMIGKPDIGAKGKGVKVLKTEADIIQYIKATTIDFHIQEFVPLSKEVGIFYYRYPGKPNGNISGIVRKEFLTITGDGIHTIEALLKKEKRTILQLKSLEKVYGKELKTILPIGEKKILVPYGNHARGAKFLDDSYLIEPQLIASIDAVCKQIPAFHYGRLDIRYDNWEDLKQGKKFLIIEVNGAGSEPTHMYDPKHSLFFAWKEIVRHWFILLRISIMNHKLGYKYLTTKEGLSMFKEDKAWKKKLALIPE